MNNDLEQFSEDLLKFMIESDHAQTGDVSALARIALAAKQAKPVCYADQSDIERIKSGNTTRIGSYQTNVMSIALYTTPQPAHTKQDGCRWNTDEDSVYSTGCGNEWQFTEGGIEDNKIKFCPYCSGKIAAPKPQSE